MTYQIQPLAPQQFAHLFHLSQPELQQLGIVRMQANKTPGFPCRLSLQDAEPGEQMLLLNYAHLSAPGPYQSAHAIFISQSGMNTMEWPAPDTVPAMLLRRTLSLRAFDTQQMMLDARLCQGADADTQIRELLALPECDFVHIHTAIRGCYLAAARRL
ncbi:DUF1203 domain-containing protein [Rheinheimera sp.]|uniref:DUF1203 domain-containing protein n=1 Tax=Rheinheimera sp. TaxID=1869214 RepID=UPI0027B9CC6A|nr:DUF1203 domain-containing protein [Rheinheimera sp.]